MNKGKGNLALVLGLVLVAAIVMPLIAQRGGGNGNGNQPPQPQIVDSAGRFIGTPLGPNMAIRQINGGFVRFNLNSRGFMEYDQGPVEFDFTTTNCTGQPYLRLDVPRLGLIHNNLLYFPNGPIQVIEMHSRTQPDGSCVADSPPFVIDYAAPPATLDLSTFTPPFDTK